MAPDTAPPLPTDLTCGVAAVLPLLYVAWADGMLTPAEAEAVRRRVAGFDWLTRADHEQLDAWLDADAPPTAEVFAHWRSAMRTASAHVSDDDRTSLASFGAAIAGLAPGGAPPEARRALDEVEAALGIAGGEAVRHLVGIPAADPHREGPPAFPPAALRALLDGDRAPLRDRVRELLRDPAFAYPDPQISDREYREIVFGWTRRLADAGLGSLAYPAFAGGEDDIGAFIAAFETVAYHDLSLAIKYGVQFGLWGGSVNGLGSDAQRRALLPAIGSLELPGAFAMSERNHGSNVRDLQTTATFDAAADEWVLVTPTDRDHKEWIGNAAMHARQATVFAQLHTGGEGYGVHAFVVPLRGDDGDTLPGIRIEDSGHKMGLNGVDNGRIWFDGVRVPREALLSRFATVSPEGHYASDIPSEGKRFFTMLGVLVGGRIAVGSAAVSAAKAGLTIAVRYGSRRRQFGPAGGPEVPLLDYVSHQRRLLPLVATAYGLTFALHDLSEAFAARAYVSSEPASADAFAGTPDGEGGRPERGEGTPAGPDQPVAVAGDAEAQKIETEAAALKSMASWHATRALQEAREACGGEGYRWSSRIAHRKADADIFTTFEGDNTVLMLQVAKGLLAGYRQEFSDMNVFGLVRYLREQADVRLGEIRPSARLGTSEEHLRDPTFHAELFQRRERTLLISAAARLKRRIDGGMDSFDAFVEVQDHLLTLARAHAERLVLDSFQAAVARTTDPQLKNVLSLVCALYALEHVERDRGWFQEQGLFEGNVAKAIRVQVNALLARLRPLAVELVDSFGIPDELLGSDIAGTAAGPGLAAASPAAGGDGQ